MEKALKENVFTSDEIDIIEHNLREIIKQEINKNSNHKIFYYNDLVNELISMLQINNNINNNELLIKKINKEIKNPITKKIFQNIKTKVIENNKQKKPRKIAKNLRTLWNVIIKKIDDETYQILQGIYNRILEKFSLNSKSDG